MGTGEDLFDPIFEELVQKYGEATAPQIAEREMRLRFSKPLPDDRL